MAVTIAGITCQELVANYEERYDVTQGPGATKCYLCPWANRFTVVHGILGASSAPSVGGLITLNLPMAFPELAAESTNALASMYARTARVYGVGPPTQGTSNISFTSAVIEVQFGSFPWTFQGVDYFQLDPTRPYVWVEQHIEFASEYITVPGQQVFYKSSGKPLNQANWGFFSPLVDMTLSLKNVPYLPAAQILSASQAPINSVTYLGCAAGYLMFKGASDHRTQASDGTQTSEFTISFSYRPIAPWDYVYNQANSGGTPPYWDQVVNAASGGTAVIGRSDLSTIIPSAYVA